jgi:uncharacterized protein YdhG (YjbR/CyaY superfamily)
MKRANPRRRAPKPKGAPATVDEYIKAVPEASRAAFGKLRAAVQSAVPAEAVEVISYRIPAFKQGKVLVWFAAFSEHCSLFPTAQVIADFENELKNFSTSKGTVHFPNDKSLPLTLIKRMIKARVAQATKTATN